MRDRMKKWNQLGISHDYNPHSQILRIKRRKINRLARRARAKNRRKR